MDENALSIEQELCEFVREGKSIELDQYLHTYPDVSNFLTSIIQQQDEYFTPLILATLNGHDEVVRVLLSYFPTGIEVEGTVYDSNGNLIQYITALWCALDRGYFTVAHTLIAFGEADVNHGPNYPLLIDACMKGRLDIVQFLIENGYADANETLSNDANKYSSLILSAHSGHTDVVTYLLHIGANIDYITHVEQDTALSTAAREGHLATVKLLCLSGASITVKNRYGKSPMMLAAERDAFEAVDFLLEFIHDETTFDDLELVASSYITSNDVITLNERQRMIRLLRKSLEQRALFHIPKIVAQPIAAYDFQKECETIDELDQIQYNNDRVCIEALLICERILLIRMEVQLFNPLLDYEDILVETNQFDRSFHLNLHLFHLHQQMKIQFSLERFIWIFCRMITAQISIPVDQFLKICHLALEPSQQKTTDEFIKYILHLIALAAKVLEESTISNEDRRSILLWIRKLCRKQYITTQGQNLLHLSVSFWTSNNIFSRRTDIIQVLPFPNVGSTQLLLEYGQPWIDINARDNSLSNTALHIVSHGFPPDVKENVIKIVEILLNSGVHIDYVNYYGKTPLDKATDTDVRTLLRSRQNPSRLKCLCARLITIEEINYEHVWPKPTALTNFIQMHNSISSEDEMGFGLFD